MNEFIIKGWCPSYTKPALAKDGYFLRISPDKGYLSLKKTILICDLSIRFGNGLIDLTNRGRLQIRGIKEKNLENIILILKQNKIIQNNNNHIIINPFWEKKDKNILFYQMLKSILSKLPLLPDKFLFAVDLGQYPVLSSLPADIRLEHDENGKVIIRADGHLMGKNITPDNLLENTITLSKYFVENSSKGIRRMSHLINTKPLSYEWCQYYPAPSKFPSMVDIGKLGIYYGTKYGRIRSTDFKYLLKSSNPKRIRFTPFKSFIFEKGLDIVNNTFLNRMENPVNDVHACPGKDSCSSSTINTYEIADKIRQLTNKGVHVSGCTKGCAFSKKSEITLVGNNGLIDVIYNGKSNDKPQVTSITKKEILTKIDL